MSKKKREPEGPVSRAWMWLAAAGLLGALALSFRLPFIAVAGVENGDFLFMRYRFFDESSDHPRLQLLRRREKLDAVVAPGRTQFEKFVLLRKWARAQWEPAGSFRYPPWDAVEILDLARRGNRGFCAQYAVVFVQACLSLGLHARYGELGHFLAEVWSDELGRWVVMDPTGDVHYEKDGRPLRGRELDEAAWRGRPEGIVKVGSDGRVTPLAAEELKGWRGFSIVMRNNHLSQPVSILREGHPVPLTRQADPRSYPLISRDEVVWSAELLAWRPPGRDAADLPRDRTMTGDPGDFHNVYNQSLIFVVEKDARQGMVKLKLLAENSPGLESFQVDTGAQRFEQPPPGDVALLLKPGRNRFSARVRTSSGWLGPPSSIRLIYKPAWSFRIL
ncbi:MAG: transglutaminase domain-containing protein [Elusimicrobia bacterium]|nr:transglutaminase domain-containing protein [Elusimicrobiota bacterium]